MLRGKVIKRFKRFIYFLLAHIDFESKEKNHLLLIHLDLEINFEHIEFFFYFKKLKIKNNRGVCVCTLYFMYDFFNLLKKK